MVEEILLVKAPKIFIFTREPHIKTDQGCRVVTVAEIAPILLRSPTSSGKNLAINLSFPVIEHVFEYPATIMTCLLDQYTPLIP